VRAFLIGVLVIILIGAGLVFFVFNRISYTPDWYRNHDFENTSTILKKSKQTLQQVQSDLQSGKAVRLHDKQLESMILSGIQQQTSMDVRSVVRAFKIETGTQTMRVEAIVNLKNLPRQNMPKKAAEMLDMVSGSLPLDALEEFYTCIEGKPVMRNGQLGFDKNANIQLGKVSYSLREIVGQFGDDGFLALNKLPFNSVILEQSGILLQP